jgi:hypothetical protein
VTTHPHNGTDTSLLAAARLSGSRSADDERGLLAYLRKCGGATDAEIAAHFGWTGDYERPRRYSLVKRGYVEDSGLRRVFRDHGLAKVWRAREAT